MAATDFHCVPTREMARLSRACSSGVHVFRYYFSGCDPAIEEDVGVDVGVDVRSIEEELAEIFGCALDRTYGDMEITEKDRIKLRYP